MFDAMNTEYDAWQDVVKEFRNLSMDMNDKRYDPLIKSVCVWGERLHALRAEQSAKVVETALIQYLDQYETAKKAAVIKSRGELCV